MKGRTATPTILENRFVRTCMMILLLLTLAVALPVAHAFAAQATVTWNPTTNYAGGAPIPDFVGYRVYMGSVSGNYSQVFDAGTLTSYTINDLADGASYYFAVTAYDSLGNESGYSSEVNYGGQSAPPPTSSLYTLTASAGSGGSITPSGSVVVSQGTSQTFSIAPSAGYKIVDVSVDGASAGAVSSYTFSNIAADHTIAASFAVNTYSITASAGTGGTVSPAGTSTVTSGGSKSYTITANSGYKIASVTVDGVSVGAVSTYNFSNVTANHTISATFTSTATATTFSINATAGTGGTVSPAGTSTVTSGGSKSYTITANSGYKITSVTVDGVSVGAVSTYTFTNVAANHTISATFTSTSTYYSISSTAGAGGNISPIGLVSIKYGRSKTYSITAYTGYKIAGVTVDGVSVGAVSSYTFSNVTANHTIAATFVSRTATSYSIAASAGTGGTISPAGTSTVTSGGSKAYTISANSGYTIANVTVDGVSVGAISSYTFSNVTASHTIAATFSSATAASANIPHAGWSLKYADSQETVGQNGAAANAFDANNTTLWHTQWQSSTPACPHEIQINLGKAYTLTSFSYLPRQDGGINGTIANYEFYVSSDGVNWGTPVASGTFANNTTLKQVSFTAKQGQYIRLRALSEVNGGPWTSVAEINVAGY